MGWATYEKRIREIISEILLTPEERAGLMEELKRLPIEAFGEIMGDSTSHDKTASGNADHMNRDKKNEHAGDALGYVSGGEGLPDGLTTFDSGATRSSDVDQFRYDLMSPIALGRVAVIFAEGAKVHGERNWEKGIPKSAMMNHAMAHLMEYVNGSTDEDHLAKAVWGFMGIMHFEGKDMEGY